MASRGDEIGILALTRQNPPADKQIGGVARTKANVEGALGDRRWDLLRDLPVF
ncbi:MAG: hypothetical protein QF603_02945 [Alphaproteobacteria bacterium]|jgi:hypothetical protein|nr:hypothetical protein [Alphaproteobacteria bacterium]HJM90764.1 hypothetical protein [Alphaproteobacteria bacterium]|tara:strand:- start:1118 stop:1276 length:159 start_codon:yes stop_codon:yes gene_type:complete